MDAADIAINELLHELLKNKSLKQIIEEFPNIKNAIYKVLNNYAEKNNLNDVDKQKFIEEKYNKIKINGLSIKKFDEELNNNQKEDTIMQESQINSQYIENQEAKLKEKEILDQMRRSYEFEKKFDDFMFEGYMDNFKR